MLRVNEGVAFVVLLVLADTPSSAQTPPSWVPSPRTGPSARQGHAMAFDSLRGHTVLFGGDNGLPDTWEWDGTTWIPQIFAVGPSARYAHAMVYDSARDRVVLFGGVNASGNGSLGDTWEWDGTNWTQRATAGPAARYQHAMAYDSQRGRTVMFGGHDNFAFGDTWEWDGTSWTQAPSSGGLTARYAHAMAYDSQRGRTVLFGGSISGVYTNETYEWDGSTWALVSASGQTACVLAAMAYDSQRGRAVLFGGFGTAPVPYNYLGDTWEWDGAAWAQVSVSGPSARYSLAMVYDSQRGRTVLFGGHDYLFGNLADIWEWAGSFSSTAAIFGSGCGNPQLGFFPDPNARPTTGTTAQASLTNIPSSLAFVALGWSRTMFGPFPLPLTLAQFGLPNCSLLTSSEFSALPVTLTGSGTAMFGLPLPNINALIGLHVYLQGWANAPGANAGDLIVSNGVDWGIGNG